MSFARFVELLEAVPPADRRMASGRYQREDGVCCVIGICVPSSRSPRPAEEAAASAIWSLQSRSDEVRREMADLRLGITAATWLQIACDDFDGPDEDRFAYVLASARARANPPRR